MKINFKQMKVIQDICTLQQESLRRLFDEHVYTIYNGLYEDGYDVNIHQITTKILKEHKRWKLLKAQPEKVFELLDELDLGILRHHLWTEFYMTDRSLNLGLKERWRIPEAKELWNKLNLKDDVDKFPN
jgi:hypothetical protein